MYKESIKYLLLLLGIILLGFGIFFMYSFSIENNTMLKGILFLMAGIFLISKQLAKTKELPSKKFKEQLKKKELNK